MTDVELGEEVAGTVITLERDSMMWSVWFPVVGQEPHLVVCLNLEHLVH